MFRQTIGIVSITLITGNHAGAVSMVDGRSLEAHVRAVTTLTTTGKANARASTYPLPAGYLAWYLNDPECPGSPDSFAYYVEYWNEDESFHHDVYAGHSSYYCGVVFKGQTLDASSVYQNCVSTSPPQWNCQLLYATWQQHP